MNPKILVGYSSISEYQTRQLSILSRAQAALRVIIPEILRVWVVSRSIERWNTPSTRSTWSNLSPILVTLLHSTRSICAAFICTFPYWNLTSIVWPLLRTTQSGTLFFLSMTTIIYYSRSSCGQVSYGIIYIFGFHCCCCCRLHHPRVCVKYVRHRLFHSIILPASKVVWRLLWHLHFLPHLILSIKVIILTTVHSDISASGTADTPCTRGVWIFGTTHTSTHSQHSGGISRFECEYCSHSQSLAMFRPQAP